MPAADEQQLISRAKEGSHEAFRVLVERHMKQAYDVAYGFVGNHDAATDITQEAFVAAHRALGGFRGDSEFSTWLHRIVVNLALTSVKRDRHRAEREVDMEHPAARMAIQELPYGEAADLREHVERAIHELPTLQRAVVILRHVDGLSTRQVSRILRCSEGTVKTHLYRGLKKLKDRLEFLRAEQR
jgi:RNA polymerase sigma-70 factor (ECF subfamily)